MLARRGKPRRSSRVRDEAYLAWCRRQPCAARGLVVPYPSKDPGCGGRIDPDHTGARGIGQKADDRSAISLCRHHHRCRSDFTGPFKGWDKEQMRGWLERQRTSHNHEYTLWKLREEARDV